MSSTVMAPSGLEVSSNHEPAAAMMESLAGKDENKRPRVLVDEGQAVKDDPDGEAVSEAARKLGEKGGKAAAEKRAADLKAKPAEKPAAAAKPAKGEAVADDDGEGEDGESAKPLGKPRDDPRARIQQLSQQKREAEAKARAAEERAARNEQRLAEIERRQQEAAKPPAAQGAQGQPKPGQKWTPEQGRPTLAQFNTVDELLDAHRAYTRHELQQELQQREMAERGVAAVDQHVRTVKERIDTFVKSNPDFWDQVSEEVKSLRPSFAVNPQTERHTALNTICDEIHSSEHGPALMLHLSANDNAELQRLAALPNARLVSREMAKIEGRLSRSEAATADTSSERGVSRVRQPVRSVTGSPQAASPDLSGPLSLDEYVSRRARAGGR